MSDNSALAIAIRDFLTQTILLSENAQEAPSREAWQALQQQLKTQVNATPVAQVLRDKMGLDANECLFLWLAAFYQGHLYLRPLHRHFQGQAVLRYEELYPISHALDRDLGREIETLFKASPVFLWHCVLWTPSTQLSDPIHIAPDLVDAINGYQSGAKTDAFIAIKAPMHGFVASAHIDLHSQAHCHVWQGPSGSGRRTHAHAWSALRGRTTAHLAQQKPDAETLFIAVRTALLQGFDLVFDDLHYFFNTAVQNHVALKSALDNGHLHAHVLASNGDFEALDAIPPAQTQCHTLGTPTPEQARTLWQYCCAAYHPEHAPNVDWQRVTETYRLLPKSIAKIATQLCKKSRLHTEDILQACQQQTPCTLANLAKRADSTRAGSDLNLSEDTRISLEQLSNYYQKRYLLHAQLPHRGLGVRALFWGPPGTGKTQSAKALAHTLGLPIYQVDLGSIQSKWLGETEKNLARLFEQAQAYNALLFFDEADALFSKRTQVQSVQDKHSNFNTGFLLQAIEDYQGLLILATNYKNNLDPAFLRRLHFVICFDLPDVTRRAALWDMWKQRLNITPTLNTQQLAEHFEISPARIENICISAKALALHRNSKGQGVHADDVKHALIQEYSKFESQFIAHQKITEWFKENPS